MRSGLLACAAIFALACGGPPVAASPVPTPTTSPSPATSAVAPSTATPSVPRGPLLWEAKLDASGAELDLASQYVVGDVNAAKIQPIAGGVEVRIVRTGGPTGVSFRRVVPASFVAEMDFRVEPGSDIQFVWRVRSGDQLHLLKVDTAREVIEFVYVDPADWPNRLQPIGPGVAVTGLQSGRVVTLAVVADAPRYTVFLDGQRVADIADARLTSRSLPLAFGAFGEHGLATILGLRVFALPGRS